MLMLSLPHRLWGPQGLLGDESHVALSVSSLFFGTFPVLCGRHCVKVGLGPWNVLFKVFISQQKSPPTGREGDFERAL